MRKKAFIYFASFSTVGLLFGTLGPILTDLEQQLHINLDVVSYLFFANAIGFMIGAITGGKVSNNYPKQAHKALGCGMIVGATAFCCFPFVQSEFKLYFCALFVGWSAGQTCTIGNVCMLILCDSQINDKTGSSESGPYMQFLHFSYAIGPLICPLLVQLSITITGTYHSAVIFMVVLMIPVAVILLFMQSPTRSTQQKDQDSQSATTEFDILLAKNTSYASIPIFEDNDEKKLKLKLNTYSWAMVITFACFLSMYCGAEWSYGAYTTLFGMQYLEMSPLWSRMLCSAYWFGFTGGRLLGVWIAFNVRTETVININLSGSFMSMAVLSIVVYATNWNPVYISWILSVSYGLFMASTYPAMFTILEETVVVNGNYAMVLLLGTGVGAGIVPMIVGHIMYYFEINAFVLTSFAMTTMIAIIYVISSIFRYHIKQINKKVRFKKGKTSSLMQLF